MTILIVTLLFFSFFQTALIPADLVLLILISRSFIVSDQSNYWIAFFFGLLVSLLLSQPLGVLSIIYLLVVKLVQLFKGVSFSSNWLMVLPLSFLLLLLDKGLEFLIFHQTPSISSVLAQMLSVIPIYLLVRFWEERFIPKNDIRLKIRK